MAEPVSTDQLPVKLGQEYRVKLGKSFTFPRENAFHTIKYDFKPLSVDPTKSGKLKVAEDEVNVLLPLVQAESTDDVAQFRGPRKPVAKECVLIIDTTSGEAVLERISNSIQLKAIRDGRKSVNPRDRSVSPAPTLPQSKTTPISKSTTPATTSTTNSASKKRPIKSKTSKTAIKQEPPSHSYPQPSLDSTSTKKGSRKSTKKSAAAAVKTEIPPPPPPAVSTSAPHVSSVKGTGPSMPVFGAIGSLASGTITSSQGSHSMPDPASILPTPSKKIKLENSSSSSDSSSSDSSDSESESNDTSKPLTQYSNSPLPPLLQSGHMPQFEGHMAQPGGRMTQPSSHMTQHGGHMTQQGGHINQMSSQVTQQGGLGQMSSGHVTQPRPPIGHLPQQRPPSTSSSSSDSSDSSSGTSSSDSSDSSDQENDREVASAFTQQQSNNIRPRTMSQLRTDLQLSDSGSDSDS